MFWFIFAIATVNLGVGFYAAIRMKRRYDALDDTPELAAAEWPPAVAESAMDAVAEPAMDAVVEPSTNTVAEPAMDAAAEPVTDAVASSDNSLLGEGDLAELEALMGGSSSEPGNLVPVDDTGSSAATLDAAVDASLQSAFDDIAAQP